MCGGQGLGAARCVLCNEPWERYAAQKKCIYCKMEVLVCRTCDRQAKAKGDAKVPIDKSKLVCPLCSSGKKSVLRNSFDASGRK